MKTLDINIFQLIILIGSFQALIFSAIIFINKRYNTRANVFLGLTVFVTGIAILQHMLIDMNVWTPDTALRKLYIPIQWLIMPMLYLHINEFLYKNSLKSRFMLYLILPFFIVTAVHIAHFLIASQTRQISELPDHTEQSILLYTDILSFVFNGIVIGVLFRMIKKFLSHSTSRSTLVKNKITLYRKIIVLAIICVTIGIGGLLLIANFNDSSPFAVYPFYIILSGGIYWVGYVGISKKEFARSKDQKTKDRSNHGIGMFNKIDHFITEEAYYLDTNLTLDSVASQFAITPGYLSKLVNQHTDKHFNDYINVLRVEVAKKMMEDGHFGHYTVESIGLESGFRSKSNFYTSFKKFTGQTPNQYRKQKKKS